MKRIVFLSILFFSALISYAQEDVTFYKHEVRASLGPSLVSNMWISNETIHSNFSVAYFYHPVKWFWVGGNFVNIFGNKTYYHWREYSVDGNFKDSSKSKIKYCAVIAPEIRFSYYQNKELFLYYALSYGIAWENGYSDRYKKYPQNLEYFQVTYFGISCNLGKNNNFFFGSEFGFGCKCLISMNGGYRF